MRRVLFCSALCSSAGFTFVPSAPPARSAAQVARPLPVVRARGHGSAVMLDLDMSTLVGVGAALFGVGGGIGLIAFTEGRGKRNEELESQQPCVECKGGQVVTCKICKGSGTDPLADLVKGVRDEVGETVSDSIITVEDWGGAPKQVELFQEIKARYPPKVTSNVCSNCEGRGVVVCDNCQGTGLQPRFLERYSADDFMD